MTQEEYIKNRVDNQISYFGSAASKNKKGFYVLSICKIALSLGLCMGAAIFGKGSGESIVVATMSAMITMAESIMLLFKSNEKWVIYREASEKLKKEKFLFSTMTGPYYLSDDKEAFNCFAQKVEAILDETNVQWTGIEKKKGEEVHA